MTASRPVRPIHWLLVFALASALARAEEPSATVRAERPAVDGQAITRIDLAPRRAENLHLGQLLAGVPGALALDFGGVLATTTLSLRGGTGDQALVTLDGIPLGSPAGGGLDLSLVPAALIGEARITRGGDGRRGAFAMGGAVDLTPATGRRFLVTAGSLGTFGLSASTSQELATTNAVWRLSAAADARRSNGVFGFHRDPTPEVGGNDALSSMARANNDASIGSLLFRAERRGSIGTLRFTSFGSMSARGLPGPIYSPTPDSRQDERSLSSQLAWEGARGELPVTVRLGTLSTRSRDVWAPTGSQSFLDVSTRPLGRLTLGSLTLLVSGLVGHESFRGSAHGEHGRLRTGLGAGLVKDRGLFTGDVSLRAERWGTSFGLLPRAGGSVRLARGWTMFANTGGGFRPPSFGELYYAAGPVLPNPDLSPERSWSGDLGLRFDRPAGKGVTASASLSTYAGLYDDVIIYELVSGSRAKPFNFGRARTNGLEAEASVTIKDGAASGLGAELSGTLLRTENLVDGPNSFGNDLPYRPRTKASLHLTYASDLVRARAGVDWTGEAFANRANTRTIASFADVNGSLSLPISGAWRLGIELRNALDVTDRACIEGYPLPGRVVLAHLVWENDAATPSTP